MRTIYKFEHNNNIYIGSTINFKSRCWAHNQHKKQERHKHLSLYQYCNSCDIKDVRDHMTIILEFNDDQINKTDMRKLEQDYIGLYEANLNSIRAIK